jgi:ABC-type antimicrobial peptide transport system permease subunit
VYRPAIQSLSRGTNPETTHVTLWVHIRSGRALPIAEVREAASAAGTRAAVLSLQRVPDMVATATRQPAFRMTLLLWFCGASVLLAAIGIYGTVAQSVTERVREIAIRIALGARPQAITMSLVRKAVTAGIVGLAIGLVLSLLLARTLQSMLYGVRASDAFSLMAAGLLLLAVTAVAAWLPALRATRAAAVHVLRA